MNIQLKRFTTNARLSEETTAFAADVWVDGKKAGYAKNDGHGGSTMVDLDRSVRDKVEAYGKALVPAEYARFTGGAEWVVDQLVEAELAKRFDKKIAKADAKEKAVCAQQGLLAARFLHKTPWSQGWTWFSFPPGSDPKATASEIAAKNKTSVDELVVLTETEIQKREEKREDKSLAETDAAESACASGRGLRAARYRRGNTWYWFVFKPGADPKTVAAGFTKIVDELVVLS